MSKKANRFADREMEATGNGHKTMKKPRKTGRKTDAVRSLLSGDSR